MRKEKLLLRIQAATAVDLKLRKLTLKNWTSSNLLFAFVLTTGVLYTLLKYTNR